MISCDLVYNKFIQLSQRFSQAVLYASFAHAQQKRNGTEIPYISHLLAVASIALEHGANENEAIAALLHDAPEDAGGEERLEDIRQLFGDVVADIVEGCTDTFATPKPAWKKRKEDYIAKIPSASSSIRFISASDKLHNASCILRDYCEIGEKIWPRFAGGEVGVLWYYRSLINAYGQGESFRRKGFEDLVAELNKVVTELERITTLAKCAPSSQMPLHHRIQ